MKINLRGKIKTLIKADANKIMLNFVKILLYSRPSVANTCARTKQKLKNVIK